MSTSSAAPKRVVPSGIVRSGFACAIVGLVLVCFLPALGGEFLSWDDNLTFTDNPHYRGLSRTHLTWMLTTTHVGQYRPLTWVSYGIDYTLWGMNPAGYHLTDLLLHAANGVLFYLLIAAFLRRIRSARGPANTVALYGAAAVGALFFAIHPLRVEVVAWASERQELLCGLFVLLALLAYLRMEDEQRTTAGSGRRWLVVSVVCFTLSLLSKPAGLMLPVVLLVLDHYPLRRFATNERRPALLLEKLPYAVLALGATACAYLAKQPQAMISLADHGVVQRAMQGAYGLCFYVWKTVAPFRLSPLYLLHRPLNPGEPRYVLSALGVVAITVFLISLRRRYPWALTAWACYVITVSPVLGFVQNGVQITADRYTYLACLPWAVLAAAGIYTLWLARLARRVSPFVWYATAALLIASLAGLGLQTSRQTYVWRDSSTLWSHVLRLDPTNYVAYNNRGLGRQKAGDLDGAMADISQGMRFNAPDAGAFSNRGIVRQAEGDLDAALADYDEAIRLSPTYALAHNNRGYVLQMKGDLHGALAEFNLALRLDAQHADAYVNRGKVRQVQGDLTGALADYSAALRFDPEHAKAYNNRGTLRHAQGDLDGALADFDAAIRLAPDYANAYSNRGNTRQAKGDLPGAIADFTQAVRLDPKHAYAYYNRGNARKAKGDLDGALADYDAVIRLDPQNVSAFNNRGNARKAKGDLEGALADYNEALRLNPQYANAYNSRGSVRQVQGDLPGAIADYSQALQLAPPGAASRSLFERNLAAAQQAAATDRNQP